MYHRQYGYREEDERYTDDVYAPKRSHGDYGRDEEGRSMVPKRPRVTPYDDPSELRDFERRDYDRREPEYGRREPDYDRRESDYDRRVPDYDRRVPDYDRRESEKEDSSGNLQNVLAELLQGVATAIRHQDSSNEGSSRKSKVTETIGYALQALGKSNDDRYGSERQRYAEDLPRSFDSRDRQSDVYSPYSSRDIRGSDASRNSASGDDRARELRSLDDAHRSTRDTREDGLRDIDLLDDVYRSRNALQSGSGYGRDLQERMAASRSGYNESLGRTGGRYQEEAGDHSERRAMTRGGYGEHLDDRDRYAEAQGRSRSQYYDGDDGQIAGFRDMSMDRDLAMARRGRDSGRNGMNMQRNDMDMEMPRRRNMNMERMNMGMAQNDDIGAFGGGADQDFNKMPGRQGRFGHQGGFEESQRSQFEERAQTFDRGGQQFGRGNPQFDQQGNIPNNFRSGQQGFPQSNFNRPMGGFPGGPGRNQGGSSAPPLMAFNAGRGGIQGRPGRGGKQPGVMGRGRGTPSEGQPGKPKTGGAGGAQGGRWSSTDKGGNIYSLPPEMHGLATKPNLPKQKGHYFKTGIVCPIKGCKETKEWVAINSMKRHYKEAHCNKTDTMKCLVNFCGFTSSKASAMRWHLKQEHNLMEEYEQSLSLCPLKPEHVAKGTFPNATYVDPKGHYIIYTAQAQQEDRQDKARRKRLREQVSDDAK